VQESDSREAYQMARLSPILAVLLLSATAVSFTACNKKPAASSGQVIARVGKEDITEPELENEFHWTATPLDKRDDDATVKRLLGEIVVRKYLAQQAVNYGVDLQPNVLLDLLRQREQILANADLQRIVASKDSEINKAAIDKFIESQPWRFANRKVWTVEQITVPLTRDAQAAVAQTSNLKSLDATDEKLNELKVLHNRSMGVLSSSEFSQKTVDEIEAKKDTDQFYLVTPAAGVFFKIKKEEPSPITGEQAERIARQELTNQLIRSERNAQTQAAQVKAEYEGRYVRIMGNADSTGAAAPNKN
jgi:EpsD family peptidyl-prolyl cis-trans isomerase